MVSIVGTRRCTAYGQDCVRSFVKRLAELCPETLIVSGLAYGIDICAHREALAVGLDTVAVLAHGLDNLYPPRHKDTADSMLAHGGLLTEHFTHTNADKLNFLRRNRIVAGLADAVVVAESASHGGALVTARIAQSYSRDVMAFPGRVGDEYSEGCNNLIRDNKAALITSADDLVRAMGWQDDARLATARRTGIERTLFPELTAEEQAVADILAKDNDQQINTLSTATGIKHAVNRHGHCRRPARRRDVLARDERRCEVPGRRSLSFNKELKPTPTLPKGGSLITFSKCGPSRFKIQSLHNKTVSKAIQAPSIWEGWGGSSID